MESSNSVFLTWKFPEFQELPCQNYTKIPCSFLLNVLTIAENANRTDDNYFYIKGYKK